MYIKPQTKVYTGMVVGEHNKENDLEINVLKENNLLMLEHQVQIKLLLWYHQLR